jgi:hypothetical protein
MFSPDIHYLVGQEKLEELRRDAARHQLIQTARLGRPDKRESLRRMAGRIGSRLMTWGSKLQGYDQGRHQTLTQRG